MSTKPMKCKFTKPRKFSINRVYVAPSKIAGLGVFAGEDIEKNDRIEVSPVLRIVQNADMLMHTDLNRYLFSHGQKDSDDAFVALGYGSMYNHSFFPNAFFSVWDDLIIIVSKRDIKKGEEITVNYGWDEETMAENGITK